MADFRLICCLVIVACLGFAYTAPVETLHNVNSKQDLAEKFVQFLRQDQQLSNLIQQDAELVRNRRQTSMEADVDTTTLETADAGGFFDRATKFVMEVLQRFLRWINTDE